MDTFMGSTVLSGFLLILSILYYLLRSREIEGKRELYCFQNRC